MRTVEVEVWSPNAKQVWLYQGSGRLPLRSGRSGWWTSSRFRYDELGDYWLGVDEGEPRPDPRSPYQPAGPKGPSRQIDHQAFDWSDSGFQARPLSAGVLYELHIGTFSKAGTFDGAIDHLDHLVQLGITHVELMPVAEFPGQYGWGYDGVCLFAPAGRYGGPDGLKRLVNACHQRGLAVVLDVVYNHVGPVANHLEEFAPYFTQDHRTPWGKAINFDGPDSDEVRRFFCDNALMWLRDYHMDALRLDAVHAIVDTTAYPFLEQLADEVHQLSAHLGRHLSLIAESDLNDPRLVRAPEAGGYGLHAQWCDDFHHALHSVLTGERRGYYADFGSLKTLADAFQHPYVYVGQSSVARKRRHGRTALELCGDRFIAYAQNHDQIGNRAKGERLGHLVGERRAQIAAALVLTSPYVPQLFQGEEWNTEVPFLYFADWRDEPELAESVIEGRFKEFEQFGWHKDELPNPIAEQTFQACKLDWHSLTGNQERRMHQWYRRLISLRKQLFDLTDSRLNNTSVQFDSELGWLAVKRGRVLVIVQLGESIGPRVLPPGDWTIALTNDQAARIESGTIQLAADGLAVLLPPELLSAADLQSIEARDRQETNQPWFTRELGSFAEGSVSCRH